MALATQIKTIKVDLYNGTGSVTGFPVTIKVNSFELWYSEVFLNGKANDEALDHSLRDRHVGWRLNLSLSYQRSLESTSIKTIFDNYYQVSKSGYELRIYPDPAGNATLYEVMIPDSGNEHRFTYDNTVGYYKPVIKFIGKTVSQTIGSSYV